MTDFWITPEVKQLHIELTNACNAACPMCVRFYRNSPLPRPDLEIGEIHFDKFQQFFPPEVLKPLVKIMLCGTQGDPCMARDTLEICEYILQHTDPKDFVLQMHTNGGMRNPEWWEKLGTVFAQRNPKDLTCWRLIFSIDGLEDTNHLYRRNVKWSNLMANVKAFIDAGGNAVWEYLIFEHNEHQIEEARKLADELGFVLFVPKKALGVDNGTSLTTMSALTKDGQLDYTISAPKDPNNRNLKDPIGETRPAQWHPFTFESYRSLKKEKSDENYDDKVNRVYEIINATDTDKFDNCTIKCKAKVFRDDLEIFVDNFGRVLPCCYIGTHISGTFTDYQSMQLHKHMNDYGWDNFDLNKYSLKEILDAGHLNRVFADSWTKDSVKSGKMAYCSSICGEESRIDRVYFDKADSEQLVKKMKVAITGHTQGIGLELAALFNQHGHEVIGFSRTNGFDISDLQSRQTMLSHDVDVFINNAYHPTGQTDLLKEAVDRWHYSKTLIVHIGSKCTMFPTDNPDPQVQAFQEVYKAAKLEQEHIINNLLPHRNPKLLHIIPGIVDAGLSKIYSKDPNKINPTHLAHLIYEAVSMRGQLDIQQIIIAPSQIN